MDAPHRTSPAPGDARHPAPRIAPLSQDIAARIKARRQTCGLSQDALARALGVTRQTVSNWECARTIPDALSLRDIARALNTTADALLASPGPAARDRALAARRELCTVAGIVLTLQFIAMAIDSAAIGGPAPASSTGFAAFRLGICVVGGIWLWCIARREGLATVRQMIDFASLASTHPGSWGDRALRFTSRWFWTLWFALSALMYALGSGIGIARGQTDASSLIAPAFMLLIGTIPYTWERACARNARTGQSRE